MLEAGLEPLNLPWVIYAIGQEDSALERSLALAIVASKRRQVVILTNAVSARPMCEEILRERSLSRQVSVQCVSCSDSTDLDSAEARESAVLLLNQLCSVSPFVLIVDALPDGFYQELTDVLSHLPRVPKILIARELSLEYAIAHDAQNLIASHYDLVVAPGIYEIPEDLSKPSPFQPSPFQSSPFQADAVQPHAIRANAIQANIVQTYYWLAESLLASDARCVARASLGLQDSLLEPTETKPTVLILSSEEPGERSMYRYLCTTLIAQCPQINVRYLSRSPFSDVPLACWCDRWPATNYLPAADLIIGSGAYTTVYSAQLLNIPLVAFPWNRRDDLQRKRLDRAAAAGKSAVHIVTSAEEALSCVFEFLNQVIISGLSQPQTQHKIQHKKQGENQPHNLEHSTPNHSVSICSTFNSSTFNGLQTTVERIETTVMDKWNCSARAALAYDIEQFNLVRRTEPQPSQQELW